MKKEIVDCIEFEGELYDIEKIKELLQYNSKLIKEKEKLILENDKLKNQISAYKIVIESKKKRGTL